MSRFARIVAALHERLRRWKSGASVSGDEQVKPSAGTSAYDMASKCLVFWGLYDISVRVVSTIGWIVVKKSPSEAVEEIGKSVFYIDAEQQAEAIVQTLQYVENIDKNLMTLLALQKSLAPCLALQKSLAPCLAPPSPPPPKTTPSLPPPPQPLPATS